MSDKVDVGNYSKPGPHNNPPRQVAKKGRGAEPIDVDGDYVVNAANDHGTGSLKGQPMAQKKKKTLPNPSF